jgi:hypothetical protein
MGEDDRKAVSGGEALPKVNKSNVWFDEEELEIEPMLLRQLSTLPNPIIFGFEHPLSQFLNPLF